MKSRIFSVIAIALAFVLIVINFLVLQIRQVWFVCAFILLAGMLLDKYILKPKN